LGDTWIGGGAKTWLITSRSLASIANVATNNLKPLHNNPTHSFSTLLPQFKLKHISIT
jgi:hypothetical protein